VSEPRVDLVHCFGQALLKLLRLRAKDWRHADSTRRQQSKKYRKDYGNADAPRNAPLLQHVGSLSERQPEEHAQEEEEHDGVGDPEQPHGDVKRENEGEYAHDIARWQPDRLA
jgi:hypothetical protein